MSRQMRMLAVAFGPATMAEAEAGLARIREQADCVELRLDYFDERFDAAALLEQRGDLPVVVTLRPIHQGGRSALDAADRLKLLQQAAELGAEYIDVEYDVLTDDVLNAMHASGARVIVSRHDFHGMPGNFADEWWTQLADSGADVVKIVGTATDVRDCLHVFRALNHANRPTIALAMGEAGLATRVLALRSDCCLLTYAALDQGIGTAPGQPTLREMRETYRADRLRSTTRVYGLLGPHAERDRLAEYNAWFASDGFDGASVPFTAHTHAAKIVEAFRELPVSGWHVHGGDLQRDVTSALEELTPSAARIGRVNAITRRARDHALVGHWVESPREQYELWRANS